MKYCILLLSLIVTAYSATSFSFTGNITVPNLADFHYRFVSTNAWTLGLFSGAYFISGSLDVSKQPITGNFDLLEAVCYTGTGSYPVFWLTYFDETVSAKVNLDSSQNWATVDVSAAGGFMGLVYLTIDEVDPSGNIVTSKKLKDAIWTPDLGAVGCDADKNVCWVGYNGKIIDLLKNYNFRLQYVASRILGKISGPDITDMVVGPRSVESIFYIDNWDYSSTSNHLTLNMAIATAKAGYHADGSISTSDGGNNRVYVSLAKTANITGKVKTVTVSGIAQADITKTFSDNSALVAQAKAKYGASASATTFSVSFPPGAQNIVYDPTVGSGVSFSSASSFAGGIFFSLVALLLGLFFKQ